MGLMLRDELIKLAYVLGTGYVKSGQNIQMACPNARISPAHRGRDTHYSFGVRVSATKSMCNCFTCHLRGDIAWVFRRLHRCGAVDAKVAEYVENTERGDLASTIQRLAAVREEGFIDKKESRKDRRDISQFTKHCVSARSFVEKYLRARGVEDYEAEKYHIGCDRNGHRLTFPITTRVGGVVGCVGRLLLGKGPKYYKYEKFRKGEEWLNYTGLKKDVLLGECFLDITLQEVTLVEGPFDYIRASRMLPNVLCLNGLSLTEKQKERLLHFADEVTFMFDGDRAGDAAIGKLGRDLCRRTRVFVARLPAGKDPDSLLEDEIYRMYENERKVYHRQPTVWHMP